MKFDHGEWFDSMVHGAITGLLGGVVAGLIVPDPAWGVLLSVGGVTGFVSAAAMPPLKWLLHRIPGREEKKS